MIFAGGERLDSAAGEDPFPDSHIFFASASLLEPARLADFRARLRRTVAGQRALVWVAEGEPSRITTLLHDGAQVLGDTEFAGGLTVAAGTSLQIDGEVAAIDGTKVTLDGPNAGTITYSSETIDPWVRYFYATGTGSPPPLAGLRFNLLAASGAAEVRLDPSRPFDPERTSATPAPASAPPGTSTFRTRWGGAVTIAELPPHSHYVLAYDPERDQAYWTLDGEWAWGAGGLETIALLLGLSGAEYAQAPSSFILRFLSGGPAFAHNFNPKPATAAAGPSEQFPLTSSIPGIHDPVSTAWLYPLPGVPGATGSAAYYSQPDLAGLFRAERADPFLHSLPLAAAPLPPQVTSPYTSSASFPAAAYSGLEQGGQPDDLIRRFEIEVLTAARTQVIYGLGPTPPGPRGLASSPRFTTSPVGATAPTGPTGPVTTAVTPQGLLSALSPDLGDWREFVLAQAADGTQRLTLTDVHDKLREALLANRLFLVISDVERLRRYCSTRFEVTERVLRLAQDRKLPPEAVAAVAQLRRRVYLTKGYFEAGIDQVLQGRYPDAKTFFLTNCELAQLRIAGWTFDLAAWRWNDDQSPTILIIKFVEGDLEALISDRSRWTLPAEFNDGDGSKAQQQLLEIVHRAQARLPSERELAYFVDTVVGGREEGTRDEWNGVLFLNPVVPTDALPPDLGALAAGLPKGEVRAHHLGVTLSSFERSGDQIQLDDSSLFGLLLYEDTQDLVYSGSAYDFKVVALKVRFANSTIASFASQVELLVGQLFNELSTLRDSLRGDNILLDGTLDQEAYRFTSSTLNHFTIASQVVDFVEVARAQFVTVVAERTATRTVARFIFNGKLGFRKLEPADLFGYGPATPSEDTGIAYSGLMVSMEFDPSDPQSTRKLSFVAGQTTFDPSGSVARAGSLPRRFPLSPAALHQAERAPASKGSTPADLGFIPVEAPIPTGALGDVWFGLELTLSFGSPGALAPTLGFTGALLLSWAPSADQPNVAVGLRLPGSSGASRALTIMGPLKLNIGQLNLLYAHDSYLLRMANVALAFMGLKFPSGGRANALLFGNPDPTAGSAALGWYAAYAKDEKDEKKKDGGNGSEPTAPPPELTAPPPELPPPTDEEAG